MKRFTDFVGQNLTGGAGFTNDDFFQVTTEEYRVMEGLAQALVESLGQAVSAVISGGAITGAGPYDIAEAIVFLNTATGPEIRILPAQSGVTSGTKYIIPDADLDETRLYDDGLSKNFFVTKRATIGANETGAIAFDPALDNLPFIADLGADIISQAQMQDDSVGTAEIINGSINQNKMAVNSVGTPQLLNSSVEESKISADAVTQSKIADNAVIASKINANAVTEPKIQANAVTTGKINNGAVTTDKIGDDQVTEAKIANREELLPVLVGWVNPNLADVSGGVNYSYQAAGWTLEGTSGPPVAQYEIKKSSVNTPCVVALTPMLSGGVGDAGTANNGRMREDRFTIDVDGRFHFVIYEDQS